MKTKFALLSAIVFLSITCFAQNYGIKKIYAYYEEHMPGNIPVGEDGRPMKKYPIVVHKIFVEATAKTKIDWKNAWKDGKSYNVSAIEITQLPYNVGKEKISQKEVKINISKENKLWELELAQQTKTTSSPLKAKSGEIILGGIFNGKKIYKRINKETELYIPPSV